MDINKLMLAALLIVLILLWALGFFPVGVIPSINVFTINGVPITVWNLLIFAVIVWIVSLLPYPFQLIAAVILLLWLLSLLGIFSIAGLSSLLLPIIIVVLIIYLLSGSMYTRM